jgi:SPP1 family predicted phage head-tail adaptor
MRATYDGRTFDIKAVLPDSTGRRFIDLACETGANNG